MTPFEWIKIQENGRAPGCVQPPGEPAFTTNYDVKYLFQPKSYFGIIRNRHMDSLG